MLELLDTKNDAAVRSAKGRGKYLAGVRSSQFQKAPRLITRVVLDLVKMAVYKIGLDPAGMTVRLVGSDDDAAAEPADVRVAPTGARRRRPPPTSVRGRRRACSAAPAPAPPAPVARRSRRPPPLPAAPEPPRSRARPAGQKLFGGRGVQARRSRGQDAAGARVRGAERGRWR